MSLLAHKSLRALSNFYSDPNKAYYLYKSNMVKKTEEIKAGRYLKFHQDLRYRRVGTPEVESIATKQFYGGRDTWNHQKERKRFLVLSRR